MSCCSTFKIDAYSANHKYAEMELRESLRSGGGERSWTIMIIINDNVDGTVRIFELKRLIGNCGSLFTVCDSLGKGAELPSEQPRNASPLDHPAADVSVQISRTEHTEGSHERNAAE